MNSFLNFCPFQMECSASSATALLGLVSSLHGLNGAQLQSRVNNYVRNIINIILVMPFILQLSEWTGAETAFIIPTEHNESDSLHIQVGLGLLFTII